jgi:hypothetical protein
MCGFSSWQKQPEGAHVVVHVGFCRFYGRIVKMIGYTAVSFGLFASAV